VYCVESRRVLILTVVGCKSRWTALEVFTVTIASCTVCWSSELVQFSQRTGRVSSKQSYCVTVSLCCVVMSVALSAEQLAAIEMLGDEQLRDRLLAADFNRPLILKMDRESLVRTVGKWTAMRQKYEDSLAESQRRYEEQLRELDAG